MLTIEKQLSLTPDFPLSLIGAPESLLFFDIETTGLSAYHAGLYLIGFIELTEAGWRLTQYFAQSPADELAMLKAFFAKLSEKQTLISFNGDGFDLPFLRILCTQYGLDEPFSALNSFDIYRMLKPYRRMLGMQNLKLKTCEQFLGIFREDRFGGGELIEVYKRYLKTQDDALLQTLLLHNAEDLEHLPSVLPLLSYHFLLNGSLHCTEERLSATDNTQQLCLSYESKRSVPRPIALSANHFSLRIEENRLSLCVDLYEGELKFFYPDYQDYYYLPAEDYAVHKSVGEFVEAKARKKATAKTCYTRKTGLYLPMTQPVFSPIFYETYKGKALYAAYQSGMFSDQIKAQAYLKTLLTAF